MTPVRAAVLSRRGLLAGTAAVLSCRAMPAVPMPSHPRGCCLQADQSAIRTAMGAVREGSGNPRLDAALGEVLADLAGALQVRPGFGFYADTDSPNAVALSQTLLPASRGTVLVGLGLLSRVDSMRHGDLFVHAVCAHEFAHIRQYQTPYYARLDRPDAARLVELHADFMAGYCLGLQPRDYAADELVSLGHAWEDLGDSDYTARQHHGTREERIAAMEQGFALGRQRIEVGQATEAGARYLGA